MQQLLYKGGVHVIKFKYSIDYILSNFPDLAMALRFQDLRTRKNEHLLNFIKQNIDPETQFGSCVIINPSLLPQVVSPNNHLIKSLEPPTPIITTTNVSNNNTHNNISSHSYSQSPISNESISPQNKESTTPIPINTFPTKIIPKNDESPISIVNPLYASLPDMNNKLKHLSTDDLSISHHNSLSMNTIDPNNQDTQNISSTPNNKRPSSIRNSTRHIRFLNIRRSSTSINGNTNNSTPSLSIGTPTSVSSRISLNSSMSSLTPIPLETPTNNNGNIYGTISENSNQANISRSGSPAPPLLIYSSPNNPININIPLNRPIENIQENIIHNPPVTFIEIIPLNCFKRFNGIPLSGIDLYILNVCTKQIYVYNIMKECSLSDLEDALYEYHSETKNCFLYYQHLLTEQNFNNILNENDRIKTLCLVPCPLLSCPRFKSFECHIETNQIDRLSLNTMSVFTNISEYFLFMKGTIKLSVSYKLDIDNKEKNIEIFSDESLSRCSKCVIGENIDNKLSYQFDVDYEGQLHFFIVQIDANILFFDKYIYLLFMSGNYSPFLKNLQLFELVDSHLFPSSFAYNEFFGYLLKKYINTTVTHQEFMHYKVNHQCFRYNRLVSKQMDEKEISILKELNMIPPEEEIQHEPIIDPVVIIPTTFEVKVFNINSRMYQSIEIPLNSEWSSVYDLLNQGMRIHSERTTSICYIYKNNIINDSFYKKVNKNDQNLRFLVLILTYPINTGLLFRVQIELNKDNPGSLPSFDELKEMNEKQYIQWFKQRYSLICCYDGDFLSNINQSKDLEVFFSKATSFLSNLVIQERNHCECHWHYSIGRMNNLFIFVVTNIVITSENIRQFLTLICRNPSCLNVIKKLFQISFSFQHQLTEKETYLYNYYMAYVNNNPLKHISQYDDEFFIKEYDSGNTQNIEKADPSSYASTLENHPSPCGYSPLEPCYYIYNESSKTSYFQTFENLTLYTNKTYKNLENESSFLSLPIALYNGLSSISKDQYFHFSTIINDRKVFFTLPLIETERKEAKYNFMSKTIYFYCIIHPSIKSLNIDTKVTEKISYKNDNILLFSSENGSKKPYLYKCTGDYMIVHSNNSSLKYVIRGKEYIIYPYYSFKPSSFMNDYIETEDSIKRINQVKTAIQYNIPLLIEGPTSSGKTYSVEYICKIGGIRIIRYNFSPTSSPEDLIGDIALKTNKNGSTFIFKSGAFTEAFIHGGILLLDEMSLAPQSIVQSILSFLDSKQIFIDQLGQYEIREMNPYFRIIATQNPAGSVYKRNTLNTDIKDYFRVLNEKLFPPISPSEIESFILKKRLTTEFNKLLNTSHISAVNADPKRLVNKLYTIRDINRAISIYYGYHDDSRCNEYINALVYNKKQSLNTLFTLKESAYNKHKELCDYPIVPLDPLVYFYIDDLLNVALSSGSHVLVCADDEYTARKYVYAFLYHRYKLNKQKTDLISIRSGDFGVGYSTTYCSKAITSETLIGASTLGPSEDHKQLIPIWNDSTLVHSAIKGYINVLQNIDLMNSISLERLNNLLEIEFRRNNNSKDMTLSTKDVRFDERQENSDIEVNPQFRIIATSAYKSLEKFSPALNNRFTHIYIPNTLIKNISKEIKSAPLKDLRYFSDIINNEKDDTLEIYKYIERTIQKQNDFFSKKKLHDSLRFIDQMCDIEDTQTSDGFSQLIKDYIDNKQLSLFTTANGKPILRQKYYTSLFRSLCENRTTALIGKSNSGKSYILHRLLNRCSLNHVKTIYLTPDTDITQLVGSYTIASIGNNTENSHKDGPLIEALKNGYIIIFENAQYLSEELLESIQQFIDPLSNEVLYINDKYTISDTFRVIYVFRSNQNDKIKFTLPTYINQVSIPTYTKKELAKLLSNNVLQSLYIYDSIPINQLVIFNKIYEYIVNNKADNKQIFTSDPSFYMAYIVCLYQPDSYLQINSPFLHNIASYTIREEDTKNISEDELATLINEKIQSIHTLIHLPCSYDKETKSLHNTILSFYVENISLDNLEWCYSSILRILLVQRITPIPPLLIGGHESIDTFISNICGDLSTYKIELSRSLDNDYLIGYNTIANQTEIHNTILNIKSSVDNQVDMNNNNLTNNTNESYTKWLHTMDNKSKETTSTQMIFKPGQIIVGLFSNKIVRFNHMDLLSENVLPRMESLLESTYNNIPFILHESEQNPEFNLGNKRFIATIDEDVYGKTPLKNYFMYISCNDYTSEAKKNIVNGFDEEYYKEPLSFLYKVKNLSPYFQNGYKDASFYLKYISSDKNQRQQLLNSTENQEQINQLKNYFLYPTNLDSFNTIEALGSLFHQCISSIYSSIIQKQKQINMPLHETLTSLHIFTSLIMSSDISTITINNNNQYNTQNEKINHYPLILEGAPGIGKSDLVVRFFNYLEIPFVRINFAQNTELGNVFGIQSIKSKADKDNHNEFSNNTATFEQSELTYLLSQNIDMLNIYNKNTNTLIENKDFQKSLYSNYYYTFNNNEKTPTRLTKNQYSFRKNGYTIGLLLDELNLASPELLDTITDLIYKSCNNEKFYIPGYKQIDHLPHIIIVISQNPPTLSSSRGTLPKSLLKLGYYYKDLDFNIFELTKLSSNLIINYQYNESVKEKISKSFGTPIAKNNAEKIIQNIVSCAIELGKQNGIPFSLRDILKTRDIFSSSILSLEASLLLSIAYRYPPIERDKLKNSLGIDTSNKEDRVDINCHQTENNSYKLTLTSSFPISIYTPGFNNNSLLLTSSEKLLLYQLVSSYSSRRVILIYGSSPSGKTHTVCTFAKLLNQTILNVPINAESNSSLLIGRLEPNSNLNKVSSNLDNSQQTNQDQLVFKKGPLLEAMEKGYFLNLEGIEQAKNDILERINPLCEENPTLAINEGKENYYYSREKKLGYKYIHEDFRLILTMSSNNISSIAAPLQSRCIILYTEPLSSLKQICELCDSKVFFDNPFGNYIPEPSILSNNIINMIHWRKAVRILNSQEDIHKLLNTEFENNINITNRKRSKDNNQNTVFEDDFIDLLYNRNITIEKQSNLRNQIYVCLQRNIQSFYQNDRYKKMEKYLYYWLKSVLYYPLSKIMEILSIHNNIDGVIGQNSFSQIISINRWKLFSNQFFEANNNISITDENNAFVEENNPCDYFKVETISQRFILCYILDKMLFFYDSIEDTDIKNIYTELEKNINTISSDYLLQLLKDYESISLSAHDFSEKYKQIQLDHSKAKTLYTSINDLYNTIHNEYVNIMDHNISTKDLTTFIHKLEQRRIETYYYFTAIDGIYLPLYISNNIKSCNENIQDAIKQMYTNNKNSMDNIDLESLSNENHFIQYKKFDSLKMDNVYWKQYEYLSQFVCMTMNPSIDITNLFFNNIEALKLIEMDIKYLFVDKSLLQKDIKYIIYIVNYCMNQYCSLSKNGLSFNREILSILKSSNFYVHRDISDKKLQKALFICSNHGYFGQLKVYFDENTSLESMLSCVYNNNTILNKKKPFCYLNTFSFFACIYEALVNRYSNYLTDDYIGCLSCFQKDDIYEIEAHPCNKPNDNLSYLAPNQMISSHSLDLCYNMLNSYKRILNDYETLIKNSKLNSSSKYELLFPYSFTLYSNLIQELLLNDRWIQGMEEAISDSSSFTELFNKIFNNDIDSEHKILLKQIKDINLQKEKIIEKNNILKEEYEKSVITFKQLINNENNTNNTYYYSNQDTIQTEMNNYNWYMIQLYYYSWNTFFNSKCVKQSYTIDETNPLFNTIQNKFTIFDREYFSQILPKNKEYIQIIELKYPITMKSIMITMQLMTSSNEIAPISIYNNKLKFQKDNNKRIKENKIIEYIFCPMSIYTMVLQDIPSEVDTNTYYFSLPAEMNHKNMNDVNMNDEYMLLSNYVFDQMYQFFKDNKLSFILDTNFNISTFNQIQSIPIYERTTPEFYCIPINSYKLYLYNQKGIIKDRYEYQLSKQTFILPHFLETNNASSFTITLDNIDMIKKPIIFPLKFKIMNKYKLLKEEDYYFSDTFTILPKYFIRETLPYPLKDKKIQSVIRSINGTCDEYQINSNTINELVDNIHKYTERDNFLLERSISKCIYIPVSQLTPQSEDYSVFNNNKAINLNNYIYILSDSKSIPQLICPTEQNEYIIHLPKHYNTYHTNNMFIPIFNPDGYHYEVRSTSCIINYVDNGIKLDIRISDNEDDNNTNKPNTIIDIQLQFRIYYELKDNYKILKTDTNIRCTCENDQSSQYFRTNEPSGLPQENDDNQFMFYTISRELNIVKNKKTINYKQGNVEYEKIRYTDYVIDYENNYEATHHDFIIIKDKDNKNKISYFKEPTVENNIILPSPFVTIDSIYKDLLFDGDNLTYSIKDLSNVDILHYISAIQKIPYCILDINNHPENYEKFNRLYSSLLYIKHHSDQYFKCIRSVAEKSLNILNSLLSNHMNWENQVEGVKNAVKPVIITRPCSNYISKEAIHKENESTSDNKSFCMRDYNSDFALTKLGEIKKKEEEGSHMEIQFDDSLYKMNKNKRNQEEQEEEEIKYEFLEQSSAVLLEQYNGKSLDIIFNAIVENSKHIEQCVIKTNNTRNGIKKVQNQKCLIDSHFINFILNNYKGYVSKVYNLFRQSEKRDCQIIEHINIIIDINFTIKSQKRRLRTIATSILVILSYMLNVQISLYSTCGRGQGFMYIPKETNNLYELLSIIYDLDDDNIIKTPSAPFDIFGFDDIRKKLDTEKFIIISDGFSEQLISEHLHQFIHDNKDKLFLFLIQSGITNESSSETLTHTSNDLLFKLIKRNFDNNYITIDSIDSICIQNICKWWNIFYSSNKLSDISLSSKVYDIEKSILSSDSLSLTDILYLPIQEEKNNKDNNKSLSKLDNVEQKEYIVVHANRSGGQCSLPSIDDSMLQKTPSGGSKELLNELSEIISKNMIYEPLSANVIIENKATAWIASTTGTSIHLKNYIQFLLTKTGNGKLFKKKSGGKIRAYTVSVIIDCKSSSFNLLNIRHSVETILLFIRCLAELFVSSVDIWISNGDKSICIGTGLQTYDIWTESTLTAFFLNIQNSSNISCLSETIRQATAISNSRPYASIFFVFTDSIPCSNQQKEIKNIIMSNECTYIGIGIGYTITDFNDIFPTFIWSQDIHKLSNAIDNIYQPTNSTESQSVYITNPDIYRNISETKFNVKFNNKIIEEIIKMDSIYERRNRFINVEETEDGAYKNLFNNSNSSYDLGKDGAFTPWSILFIILYLHRPGSYNEKGELIDIEVNENSLLKGPIQKLHDQKGFNYKIVYSYQSAINELRQGKHRVAVITCSPGDGILPEESTEVDRLDAFIKCLYVFHNHGGGIFWLLENYPNDFEAERFFAYKDDDGYNIQNVCDPSANIPGGKIIHKHIITKEEKNKPIVLNNSEFLPYGTSIFKKEFKMKINQGLNIFFEGYTLSGIDQKKLEEKGFIVFAKDSSGNPAIMLKDNEGMKGRMIVDTAASKLFGDWSEDGTARWISNACIWLLNIEGYLNELHIAAGGNLDDNIVPDLYTKVVMNQFTEQDNIPQPWERRKINRPVTFVLSIVMDGSGFIHQVHDNMAKMFHSILEKLDSRRLEVHDRNKSVVQYQIVVYSNVDDNTCVSSQGMSLPNIINETEDSIKKSFTEVGNGFCASCQCKYVTGGLVEALKSVDKLPNCYHLLMLCGYYYGHGIPVEYIQDYNTKYRKSHKSCQLKNECFCGRKKVFFDEQYNMIKTIITKRNVHLHVIPILDDSIFLITRYIGSLIDKEVNHQGDHLNHDNFITEHNVVTRNTGNGSNINLINNMTNIFNEIIINEYTAIIKIM
ncbi:hypothetical protein WA158_000783 [Blastocystis sp. Blastoise]